MSKKMMKRSLALGALMAFVITGSVMAREITNVNEIYDSNENSVVATQNDKVLTLGGVLECPAAVFASWIRPVYNGSAVVSGWDKVIFEGSNFEPQTYEGNEAVFYVNGSDATLTIDSIGKIETNIEDNENKKIMFFYAGVGTINVNAVEIDVENVHNAIYTVNNSNVTINANNVKLSGTNGIYAYQQNSNVDINVNNRLEIIGSQAGVISGDNTGGKVDIDANEVYIKGGTYGAIYAYGSSVINVGANSGKVDIEGDVYSSLGSTVNVALGKEGSLKGCTYDYHDYEGYEEGGTINIDLGVNSIWDASNTGNLNIVTSLSGTGTVIVDEGDKVTVTDAENSNATLTVQATGELANAIAAATGEEQTEKLQALAEAVATEAPDGEGDSATTTRTSLASVVSTTETDVAGVITAQVDESGNVIADTISEATHTGNQSIGEAAVALKAHWRAHMNDMNKRMGDLRMANGETGVWTRMVRGESEFEGAKMQYNQYQLGYDEKLSVDKRWTVGAAVTFAEGDSAYSTGSTEDKSTAFAIYGTKLNNDGTFVDLIARYAHLESDVEDKTGKGDYSTNGMSVSAEFGKRIQQGNGLWIEPQVELTYGTVDSAEYKLGTKTVQVGDMDSLIGRVGFSIGKDISKGNVYARASYLYDFDGETETAFTNGITRTIEEDLGGGWWEVGVGANINLSKATYIYADIEKTFGGEVDTNWQWNLGVRYSF